MPEKAPRFNFRPMTTATPAKSAPSSGDKWVRGCAFGCVGLVVLIGIVIGIALALSDNEEPHDANWSSQAIAHAEER